MPDCFPFLLPVLVAFGFKWICQLYGCRSRPSLFELIAQLSVGFLLFIQHSQWLVQYFTISAKIIRITISSSSSSKSSSFKSDLQQRSAVSQLYRKTTIISIETTTKTTQNASGQSCARNYLIVTKQSPLSMRNGDWKLTTWSISKLKSAKM